MKCTSNNHHSNEGFSVNCHLTNYSLTNNFRYNIEQEEKEKKNTKSIVLDKRVHEGKSNVVQHEAIIIV